MIILHITQHITHNTPGETLLLSKLVLPVIIDVDVNVDPGTCQLPSLELLLDSRHQGHFGACTRLALSQTQPSSHLHLPSIVPSVFLQIICSHTSHALQHIKPAALAFNLTLLCTHKVACESFPGNSGEHWTPHQVGIESAT